MHHSDRPRTQFDMLTILEQPTEGAVSRGAPRNTSTLKRGMASARSNIIGNKSDTIRDKSVHFAKSISHDISKAEEAQPGTTRPTIGRLLQLRPALESPWEKYEKIYDLQSGGSLVVAVRKASPVELVHVREFSTKAASEALHLFRCLQHRHIVTPLEAFTTDNHLHVVLEYMPVSLDRIIDSPAYPDERQLAAILGQVVAGLAYLEEEGYEHAALTCSNILVSTGGDVKIANQDRCVKAVKPGAPRDVRALSSITMKLMQKYAKEDGAVGIDNLLRWNSNSDAVAVAFLLATTSAATAAELLQACYFHSSSPLVTYPNNRSIPS